MIQMSFKIKMNLKSKYFTFSFSFCLFLFVFLDLGFINGSLHGNPERNPVLNAALVPDFERGSALDSVLDFHLHAAKSVFAFAHFSVLFGDRFQEMGEKVLSVLLAFPGKFRVSATDEILEHDGADSGVFFAFGVVTGT